MAGYLGAIPVPQATQHRESFTATSGQTSFSTAGYTPLFLDVYLNGSHLSPADFTATNGSDVVLASGASAGDVCDIISYTAFEVNSQTFTGTTTFDGAVVINESSADVDFRVESNGNANMLFVDGGNNAVGIGTNLPSENLHVVDSAGSSAIKISSHSSGNNDAKLILDGNGTGLCKIEADKSLTFSTDGGSSESMRIDSTGAVTMPLQPAVFGSRPASNQNNIQLNSTTTVLRLAPKDLTKVQTFPLILYSAPVTGF